MIVDPEAAPSVLCHEIRRRAATEPLLVAIDGHSAAGKSTLAAKVAHDLGASVVPTDDFYRDLEPQERERLTAEEGAHRYYDWQRLRSEALAPLAVGRRASYRRFDWDAGRGLTTNAIHVEPTAIVIVEGCYSARPELSDLIDMSVLVEASPDVRARRRSERPESLDWKLRWDAAERHYLEFIRPRSTFDLVVSDTWP